MVKAVRTAIDAMVSISVLALSCIILPIIFIVGGILMILSIIAVTASFIILLYKISFAYCVISLIAISIFILCLVAGDSNEQ